VSVELDDDPARLDLDVVHGYLSRESYWARGVARATVEESVRGSWCVGAYDGAAQVGFARLVSDRATYAWLCDVFVLPSCRGRGVGDALVRAALARARAYGVRRVMLATADAHGLYRRHGFGEPQAGLFMEWRPG
jgi:GNAT superfamily N-acetyltransferase